MTDLEAALEVTDGITEEGGEGENKQVDGEGTDDGATGGATDDSSGGDDTDASADTGSAGADEGSEDSSDTSSDTDTDASPSELQKLKEDQDELRQLLRVTRRENATLRAKVGRIDDSSRLEDELDEGEGGEGPQVTRVEALQEQLGVIAQQRAGQLELYVEQMAEMNKYSDVLDVCSKTNMDTVVESAATAIAEEKGGSVDEIMLELEVDIWSRPNPYKYLYGVIKQYHPKYASAPASGKEDSQSLVDNAKDNKAASSIQDMGGSGGSKGGGWTSDRIDRLSESELHQVPGDVYEKYLQGILK